MKDNTVNTAKLIVFVSFYSQFKIASVQSPIFNLIYIDFLKE